MEWMLFGFLLTISYKSVLRAMMMKHDYMKTIDTLDDMLESKMTLMVPSDLPYFSFLLATDPRQRVKALRKNVAMYTYGNGRSSSFMLVQKG